ncbi:unnamed protein product [Toxocara canis]|uniref:Alpha-xylosidase n=1 Tax=Toxocara canis TaxID=6265 RepID=A0A183TVY4_TOXCA|nr:unnamed protein product [Toxocara canis]
MHEVKQAENVPPSSTTMLGYLTVECDGHTAHFDRDGVSFRLTLGCAVEAKFSKSEQTETNATLCFDDGVELSIDYAKGDENFEKYEFKWKSTNAYHYMKDVISTDSGGFWYGGPQLAQQRWPLMRNSNGFCPYVAGDVLKAESDPQSGMERYWLCSNKFAVFVADDIPLWTEHYEGRLSLQAQIRDSLYENFFPQTGAPVLSYTIFALKCGRNDSLKDFHMAVHRALYSGHQKFPDERIIREPIWTTWAKYKQDITQEKVLEFAKEIKDHNAPISQLELDDNWSTKYGDFEFDKAKFPNVKEMCAKLEVQGIRLTLWIHPYINIDSENAKDPRLRPFFVQTPCGKPVITKWWNGDGYIIDFTNPEAARWYENQLNKLREQGIFSFKFDSGEVTYLTRNFQLKNGKQPNDYVSAYVETAAKFGGAIEVELLSHFVLLPVILLFILSSNLFS